MVFPETLAAMKHQGRRICALTAYDFPTAKLLDEAGIDLLLVGDSLGMVVLGFPDTTEVTLEQIEHHTRPVARAAVRALVVSDLPFGTYRSPEMAVESARRLTGAGAKAVKLEGALIPQIEAVVQNGIAVVGHLGMLPQQVRTEGGYKMKGRTEADAARLLEEALAVEKAGACAIVLELVMPDVAREISRAISIPTIGIGAGHACDGQILVTHDLIGFFPWFTPKFATVRGNVADQIRQAALEYRAAVTTST